MEATKGKYEREDYLDLELRSVLNSRHQNAAAPMPGKAESVEEAENAEAFTAEYGAAWNKLKAFTGLVLGDGLLVYMLMSSKIDDLFGILFVAGVSAVCGYYMK